MSVVVDAARPPGAKPGEVYTAAFWAAFAANLLVVSSNALTFRFAELVNYLDGTERLAGLTVSVATFAAVLARFKIGEAIDRLGVRRVWVACTLIGMGGAGVLAAAAPLAAAFDHPGPVAGWLTRRLPIFAGRLLFTVGLAGQFGCSLVHIQNLVPAKRRTEAIATFGSSGFLGMMTGTLLGDRIFAAFGGTNRYAVLFAASAACGAAYLVFNVLLTRGQARPAADADRVPAWRLLVRHWPGPVTWVGGAMGLGFAVSTVFLTRFATARGLSGIAPFFMGYAISAFTFRILSRRWSERVGRHRMISYGLAGQFCGFVLLPFVAAPWHLVPPALLVGFGHALLFPAVVSLGTETFPLRYRGTASTLILGFFDVGMLVCAPVLGGAVDAAHAAGLSGGTEFVPMFALAAAAVLGVGVYYRLTAGRHEDVDVLAEAEAKAADLEPRAPSPAKPPAGGAKPRPAGRGRFEPLPRPAKLPA